jgi:hypothetical protein
VLEAERKRAKNPEQELVDLVPSSGISDTDINVCRIEAELVTRIGVDLVFASSAKDLHSQYAQRNLCIFTLSTTP